MQKFIKHWEISKNWQLLYPIFAALSLIYSAYLLATLFAFSNIFLTLVIALVFSLMLLKFSVVLFNFLGNRWKVNQKWKVIRIFLVFAITGSLSVIVTNPIFERIGLVKENFETFSLGIVLFYIIKFLLILPIYKILLVVFGRLFGEYQFFLNFAKKMLYRLGFKRFLKE